MLAWLDGRLNTLESGVNLIKGAADGLLGTLNTVVGAIEKALGSIGFRDGEHIGPGGLIYSNATMRVIYLEKSNCPVCPPAAAAHARAARVRVPGVARGEDGRAARARPRRAPRHPGAARARLGAGARRVDVRVV